MIRFHRKIIWIPTAIVLLSAAFLLQSFYFCGHQLGHSGSADRRWPTKKELRGNFYKIRKELLVFGTGNPETAAAYKNFAEKYARRLKWIEIVVKPDSLVTTEEISSIPLWLIGTPSSNSLLTKIQNYLPIKIENGSFSIGKDSYSEETDIYILSVYPNPLAPSLPLSVISGNTDEYIVDFLENSYRWSARAGDFRVFRNGQGITFGFFKQEKNGPWKVDFEKTRNYLKHKNRILETEHYVFIYHGKSTPKREIQTFAIEQERRIKTLLNRLQLSHANSVPFPKLRYHLYESLEDKGLMTGNTNMSHINISRWEVHGIFNDDMIGTDFYGDARLIYYKFFGKPKCQALWDGVGIYFSEGWGKRGFRYWAKWFHETENTISLERLLNSNIYNRESYLFMQPLAGSFVEFLIIKFGCEKFLHLYKNWPEAGVPKQELKGISLQTLEEEWITYLDELEVDTQNRDNLNNKPAKPKFQRGFCYAHEGYQIYNGYLSMKSFESLEKLRSLGVEWISLSPFGYLDDANRPGYLYYSRGAGAENDESIIAAFYAAKKLGMGVMLKPHVLMNSRNWGWPGEINMRNQEDWEKFFKYYYSWIRHYALLAEIYQMDIFCIGVELVQATQGHEKSWRDLISKIRQIYHGPLVYSANWGEEFENLTFWNDFDYIGLNCYYPLSNKDTATLEELRKGAEQMLPKIEKVAYKYQKPILLTEVGFTSTARSWQNPHKRNRGAPVVLEDQALAYRAIIETFWEKEWFYGFYWWKWPTYLEHGGKQHNGFTPNGKPAENVVKEWYLDKKKPSKRGYF